MATQQQRVITRGRLCERLQLVKITVQDALLLLNAAKVYREHTFAGSQSHASDLEADARAHLQQVLGAIEHPLS